MSDRPRRGVWPPASDSAAGPVSGPGRPEPELAPEEELDRRLEAAERELGVRQHRWFARVTLLAALATGITLLLPWTFSRRLGQSVWQLGIETQPSLLLTWLAGLITSILALVLRPGQVAQACTAITGVITLVFIAGSWQANALDALSDAWPGPGPSFAVVTALIWLLSLTAQLIADRPHPTTPTPETLRTTITHLRHSR